MEISINATNLSEHDFQVSSKDVQFPAGWLISHTENHWENETMTIDYTRSIIRSSVCQQGKKITWLQ